MRCVRVRRLLLALVSSPSFFFCCCPIQALPSAARLLLSAKEQLVPARAEVSPAPVRAPAAAGGLLGVLHGHHLHVSFAGRRCEGSRMKVRRSFSLFHHLSGANWAPQHRCRLFSAARDISAHLHRRSARFKIGPSSLVQDFSRSLLGTKKTRHHLFTTNEEKWF